MRIELTSQKAREALQGDHPRYQRTRELIADFQSIVEERFPAVSERDGIADALGLMLDIHIEQTDRLDGQPYVNHPLEVALHVLREYAVRDADIVVAALLHDSVEDQAARLVEICPGEDQDQKTVRERAVRALARRFGQRSAELVQRLTCPEHDKRVDRFHENQQYLEHVKELLSGDADALLIKIGDLSQNALQLDALEEGSRKIKLTAKYCPVIQCMIGWLESLKDTSQPLFPTRESLAKKLRDVYEEHCGGPKDAEQPGGAIGIE